METSNALFAKGDPAGNARASTETASERSERSPSMKVGIGRLSIFISNTFASIGALSYLVSYRFRAAG